MKPSILSTTLFVSIALLTNTITAFAQKYEVLTTGELKHIYTDNQVKKTELTSSGNKKRMYQKKQVGIPSTAFHAKIIPQKHDNGTITYKIIPTKQPGLMLSKPRKIHKDSGADF